MEILLNIWWKSLHRNSRYCQNHQNEVTSCFPKMVINMKKDIFLVNHQNIGCKLLPKEEKNWKFETWPFTLYQTRSSILNHCVKTLQEYCKWLAIFILSWTLIKVTSVWIVFSIFRYWYWNPAESTCLVMSQLTTVKMNNPSKFLTFALNV